MSKKIGDYILYNGDSSLYYENKLARIIEETEFNGEKCFGIQFLISKEKKTCKTQETSSIAITKEHLKEIGFTLESERYTLTINSNKTTKVIYTDPLYYITNEKEIIPKNIFSSEIPKSRNNETLSKNEQYAENINRLFDYIDNIKKMDESEKEKIIIEVEKKRKNKIPK